jgi:hypothetical protein
MIFLHGMADTTLLEKSVLGSLLSNYQEQELPGSAEDIVRNLLTSVDVTIVTKAGEAIQGVLTGNALLAIDGLADVIMVGAIKHVKRSVEKPVAEDVIRGPLDAFNETLTDNIVLLRRRARDKELKVVLREVGDRSQTTVAIVYVANLVKPGLVEEVERRINNIQVDKILFSHSIQEMLIDHPWTPFPQIHDTERPDKIIAAIYEGRVGILVDNTPFALMLPATFSTLIQSSEDYITQAAVTSLIRLTRIFNSFIAIFLPAIYIGAVSYHPGMLPSTLAISIAELRTKTPFPSFLEALIMESLLEIFQEAITRLPQKIAGAAGVVGALVIGTTIVQANLVNPLLVVVVAISALASFSMPSFSFAMALRFLRVPMLVLGATLGLYGVVMGFIGLVIHLCSLRSFGESFAGGLFDITLVEDWKDGLIRVPMNFLRSRAKTFGPQERTRRKG